MPELIHRDASGTTTTVDQNPKMKLSCSVQRGGRQLDGYESKAQQQTQQRQRASFTTLSKSGKHNIKMWFETDQHIIGIVLTIFGYLHCLVIAIRRSPQKICRLTAALVVLGIGIGEASEALKSIHINWQFFVLGWGAVWGCCESLKQPRSTFQ